MCFQRFFSFRLEPVIRDILKVGAVSCIIVILSRESGALLKRFLENGVVKLSCWVWV